MCHQTVRPSQSAQGEASGDVQAEGDAGPDLTESEGTQNPETQGDNVSPDPIEERGKTEESEDGAHWTEAQDQRAEPHREAAQGLRFSSSGDFVGFVNPVSSCSSGGLSGSHVLQGKTSPHNVHNPGEESGKGLPLSSAPDKMNGNSVQGHRDSKGPGLEPGATFCEPKNCDGTPKSQSSLESSESDNADKNQEAVSRGFGQTSVKSFNENSELLGCNDDPQSRTGNCTHLDRLREAKPVPPIHRPSSEDAAFSCTSTDNSN